MRRVGMQSSRLLRPAARLLSSRPGVGHSGHLSAELRNQHDGPAASGQGLTHAQKYLFDLNGFIVLRNMFDADIVERANDAVDAHLDRLHERKGQLRTSGLYGRESKALAGDGQTGRMDLGGMLGWEAPHREPFREVLSHPSVAKVLNELVGVGYRLDHSPLLIAQEKGAEGHTLHGGAVTESGEPAWPLAYSFRHGHMRNQLLTVCMQLSEAGQGDGGFCAVPGSHKANFPVPPALADLDDPEVCARLCTLYPRTTLPSSWDPSHTTQPFADFHSNPVAAFVPSFPARCLRCSAHTCAWRLPHLLRGNASWHLTLGSRPPATDCHLPLRARRLCVWPWVPPELAGGNSGWHDCSAALRHGSSVSSTHESYLRW